MELQMTGKKKARAVADKIKKEDELEVTKKTKEAELALAHVANNEELSTLYKDNAGLGAENLGGSLPMLKVHATGRSVNELANGKEPKDGQFFYNQTAEAFDTIECHILSISRGFRSEGFEDKTKTTFNQIMAGVITNSDDLKPFIIYMSGMKLSPMWDFGKEASKYTKAQPVPIPMFALKVKLTTGKETHKFGKSWVINFNIIKDKDDNPLVVTDPGLFTYLRDHVNTIQEAIESLISNQEIANNSQGEPPHPGDRETIKAAEEIFSEWR